MQLGTASSVSKSFPAGNYTIYLSVQDNAQAWSVPVLQNLTVAQGTLPQVGCTGDYELGTKDMVVNAGRKTVSVGTRTNPVQEITTNGPFTLTQSNTVYQLTTNLTFPGDGIVINASNVTLDMRGFTITYNNSGTRSNVHGIKVAGWRRNDVIIVNGRVVEGAGSCSPDPERPYEPGTNLYGSACSPIFVQEVDGLEIAGLEVVYRAPHTTGLALAGGSNARVHDNTIEDRGNLIQNRHQGVDAIRSVINSEIYGNYIKNARHEGIRIFYNNNVHHNLIELDSRGTNSYAIYAYGTNTFKVHHNKLIGQGEHPMGIGVIAGAANGDIYSNYAETKVTRIGEEYGTVGAAAVRMTYGANDIMFRCNTLVTYAEHASLPGGADSWGRVLFVGIKRNNKNVEFRDNVITGLSQNVATKGYAEISGIGVVYDDNCSGWGTLRSGLMFRNNVVTSNWGNVLLSDHYGCSDGYPQFLDNTFVKQDSNPNYYTIRTDIYAGESTGVFINNAMQGGASMDSIYLQFNHIYAKKKEIKVGWHLTVHVKDTQGNLVPNATVQVRDYTGAIVFNKTAESGTVTTTEEAIQYLHTNQIKTGTPDSGGWKVFRTPHSVTATSGTKTGTVTNIQLIDNRTVTVTIQ